MLGRLAIVCGVLVNLIIPLIPPVMACDLCTALSCDNTEFEEFWFPAIGNDPSLGLSWEPLNLNETQRNEISALDTQWNTQLSPLDQPAKNPESKLQALLRDSKSKTQEIVSTFKEIGTLASKSRENFELRYKLLSHDQQEKLQHIYKHREALQAKNRVMRDIAGQDMDAGMVLGSKARKRVLCPYAKLERSSAQKSSYMVL